MNWLDSNPVKILNLIASIVTVAGTVGGGIIGVHFGAPALGTTVAATIGAFVGLIVLTAFLFVVWKGIVSMMRPCPVCGGTGTVSRGYARHICPKCFGNARIF